ncbi:MAG: autoinducer synthase [Rhodobacteraceae bacterium]|nr:autoinducer synthase [Paracoccaceae bacterium]
MLRYLYADELARHPRLRKSTFSDRADQFHSRLGWDVSVNQDGLEFDAYDAMNPLYVIWQKPDGLHGGSMRFLPTTGETMVNDHFSDLTDGVHIASPFIWECTRFCLARDAAPNVSAALMLGGLEVGLGQHLSHAVGVFDARMVRIYRLLGWPPTILGTKGAGREATSVGLWSFAPELRAPLLRKSGLSEAISRHWYARAFGLREPLAATA